MHPLATWHSTDSLIVCWRVSKVLTLSFEQSRMANSPSRCSERGTERDISPTVRRSLPSQFEGIHAPVNLKNINLAMYFVNKCLVLSVSHSTSTQIKYPHYVPGCSLTFYYPPPLPTIGLSFSAETFTLLQFLIAFSIGLTLHTVTILLSRLPFSPLICTLKFTSHLPLNYQFLNMDTLLPSSLSRACNI